MFSNRGPNPAYMDTPKKQGNFQAAMANSDSVKLRLSSPVSYTLLLPFDFFLVRSISIFFLA